MALDLDTFLDQPSPPGYFYCWPLLPKRGKMFIGGEAKSFKSMLALNIAYDLSEGLDVLGSFKVVGKGKRVLLIEQEIGEVRLRERLAAIHKARAGPHVGSNLWVVSKDLGARLDTDEGLAIIKGHIEQAAPHVIIFDPLRKFHNLDEDSSTAMGGMMKVLDKLQEQYDLTSIIVHHHGKPREDRARNSPTNLRGSSVLYDEGDTYMTVTAPDWRNKHLRQLSFVLRSAEDPAPIMVELEPASMTFNVQQRGKRK